MDKKGKLNMLRDTAWELLKYPPNELRKQGINPLNLVGVNFAVDEMMQDLGIDASQELKRK